MMHFDVSHTTNAKHRQEAIKKGPPGSVETQVLTSRAPVPHAMCPVTTSADFIIDFVFSNPEPTVSIASRHLNRVEGVEHSRDALSEKSFDVRYVVVGVNPHEDGFFVSRTASHARV
jgi:hypothetical protein